MNSTGCPRGCHSSQHWFSVTVKFGESHGEDQWTLGCLEFNFAFLSSCFTWETQTGYLIFPRFCVENGKANVCPDFLEANSDILL